MDDADLSLFSGHLSAILDQERAKCREELRCALDRGDAERATRVRGALEAIEKSASLSDRDHLLQFMDWAESTATSFMPKNPQDPNYNRYLWFTGMSMEAAVLLAELQTTQGNEDNRHGRS